MDKIKVAIIGSGQIARVSHIPGYREVEGVEVVGVCDTNIEAAKKLANDFNIPFYTDSHKELLETCKPDAVSVCVPNKFHYPIVIDALNHGCNVMCEKPPAITYQEAKEMADLAEEKRLILTYGFHFRHGSNVKIIKEKIDNGEFGKIYYSRAKWLRRAGVPGWGVFTNKEIQGGGPLIDIGAHMLDLALYLFDYPEISYVSASSSNLIGTTKDFGLMGKWDPAKYTVEDGVFGTIYFADGTSLSVETSFALNMKEKDIRAVDVFGDKLGASLFPLEIYNDSKNNFSNVDFPFVNDGDLHFDAIRNFANSIMKKENILVTGRQGAYVQQVVEALYESAETNKPVFVSK